MTDNNEEVLRESLDAVDRHRNRLLIGLGAVVVLLILVVGSMLVPSVAAGDRNGLLHATVVFLFVWTIGLPLVVVIQITVMTKRILRAIELASRRA